MTAVEDPTITTASHPLEPLTGDEIAAASTLLRKGRTREPAQGSSSSR